MSHRQSQDGSIILASLFVVAILLNLVLVGLGRSAQNLLAVNRSLASSQAFHAAEAGLDDQIAQWRAAPSSAVNEMLHHLPASPACGLPGCTLAIADDAEPDGNPGRDTNNIVVVTSTGAAGSDRRRLQAVVQLDASAPETYPYSVAGSTIDMDGNAVFGDALHPETTTMFVQGPPQAGGSFLTSGTNHVYAASISFYNPSGYQPSTLCPNCADLNTFHGPPVFNWNAPAPPPPLQIDFQRYYDEAAYQNHVIRTSRRFKNETISGVWYVECGASVTIEGSVTLNGTLVHEGCRGKLNIQEQSSLTVDSTAGLHPFAPGMGIIGAPDVLTGRNTTIRVKGLMMMTGGGNSKIPSKDGLILGSLLAVSDAWLNYPQMAGADGPGSDHVIAFPLSTLTIDEARWVFDYLVPSQEGQPVPKVGAHVLAWLEN